MNTAITTLGVDEIAYAKESADDTTAFGLDNISIITRMTNDTVFARLRWDDDEQED